MVMGKLKREDEAGSRGRGVGKGGRGIAREIPFVSFTSLFNFLSI